MRRRFELNVRIICQVFVDILQRWWRGNWFQDAETKSMGLIRLMIRILSDNANFDFMDRRCFESIKNMFFFRINLNKSSLYFLSRLVFRLDIFVDVLESFRGQELFQRFLPTAKLLFKLIESEEYAIELMICFHIFLTNLIIRRELASIIQYQIIMEVGELIKLQNKKKALKKQRQSLIHNEIKKRQRERVNLDQSSVKKGFIEKHKYIAKKKFDTVVEKARKIPIQIQDNANPNTYLSRTSQYEKILERTKNKVELDRESLRTNLMAMNSFGIANKQFLISFTLHFQKQIVCQPKPFLIKLPFPQTFQQIIIVLKEIKEKDQGAYSFQSIKDLNLKVMSYAQFKQKIRNDKIFLKKIDQQQIKCLVKFQLYKNNKFFENLRKKGTIVFPIDSKKVPFSLQQAITNYADYIQYMSQHYLALTKSGNEQIFRLRTGNVDNLFNNSMTIIYELTSKLIERSKVKQNKLVKISAKTASSINFDLYQSK